MHAPAKVGTETLFSCLPAWSPLHMKGSPESTSLKWGYFLHLGDLMHLVFFLSVFFMPLLGLTTLGLNALAQVCVTLAQHPNTAFYNLQQRQGIMRAFQMLFESILLPPEKKTAYVQSCPFPFKKSSQQQNLFIPFGKHPFLPSRAILSS